MPSAIWNPDYVFRITKRDSNEMFCVGHARSGFNGRCRWSISRREYRQVCLILDAMAFRPPDTVTQEELADLAELSLCSYHMNQIDDTVDEWTEMLEDSVESYTKYQRLKSRNASLKNQIDAINRERQRCFDLLGVQATSKNMDLSAQLQSHIDGQLTKSDSSPGRALTRRDLVDMEQENQALRRSSTGLQKRLDEVLIQLEELYTTNADLQTEKVQLLDQIRKSNDDLQRANRRRDTATLELKRVLSKNTDLQAKIDKLQKDKNVLFTTFTGQSEELATKDSLAQDLVSSNNQLEKKIENLQATIERLKQEKKSLSDVVAENSEAPEESDSRAEVLHAEMTEFKSAAETNQKKMDILATQLASTMEALQNSQLELADARQKSAELNRDLTIAMSEVAQLRFQIMEKDAQRSSSLMKLLKRWLRARWKN